MNRTLILSAALLLSSGCAATDKQTSAYTTFAVPVMQAPAIYADAVTNWTISPRKSVGDKTIGYTISKNTSFDNIQISCGVTEGSIGPHLYTGIIAKGNDRYRGIHPVTYQFGSYGKEGLIGMNIAPHTEGFSYGDELTDYVRNIANSPPSGSITYIETFTGTMLYHSDVQIGDVLQFRNFLQQCGTL